MPDPQEKFIAAALAPLADNAEMYLRAEAELGEWIAEGQITPETPAALRHLEGSKRVRIFLRCLYGLMALASLVAFLFAANDLRRHLTYHWDKGASDLVPRWLPQARPLAEHLFGPRNFPSLFGEFSKEEEEIVFGTMGTPLAERFKTLRASNPSDVAWFAADVRARANWGTGGSLPDLLPTAQKLDPENGWFDYAAAIIARSGAVIYASHPRKPGATFKITSPLAVEKCISLLEEAVSKPVFRSYRSEALLRCTRLLPPGKDVLGCQFTTGLVWSYEQDHMLQDWTENIIGARAEQLAAAGDVEGFKKFAGIWEKLARRLTETDTGEVSDFEEARSFTRRTARYLYQASAKLGLEPLERRYLRIFHACPSPPDFSRSSEIPVRRKADQANLSRMICYLAWPVFLVGAILMAATRFRHGILARWLSASLLRTLGVRDYLWIILGGAVLPLSIHLAIDGLFPVQHSDEENALSRGALASAAVLACTAIFAQWRLGKRLTKKIILASRIWRIALITTVAAAAIQASIFIALNPKSDGTKDFLLSLAGIAAAYPLLLSLIAFFCRRRKALPWMLLCRAIVPGYMAAMLLIATGSFIYYAKERHWIARDTIGRIETGIPAASRYEYERAKEAGAALLKVLETEK